MTKSLSGTNCVTTTIIRPAEIDVELLLRQITEMVVSRNGGLLSGQCMGEHGDRVVQFYHPQALKVTSFFFVLL